MAMCKVLILATSDGTGYTNESASAGLLTTRLMRRIGEEPSVCKATLPVGEVPVLTRWLDTIKQCPRLLPIQNKVYIMTSPESQDAITSWARDKRASGGGFPEENILCNEIPGSSGCAVADGVAGFVQATGEPDATLIVVEADYLFEPEFGIARILEHAMIRAQDCVTFTPLTSVIPIVPRCALAMEGSDKSPKVTMVDPLGQPMEGDTMLGPLTILRKTSVAEMAAFADAAYPASRQLGEFLQRRLSSGGPPVYGLEFGECFSVETLDGFLFTHHFFEWYKQQKDGMRGQQLRVEDGKIFLSEDVKLGGDVMAKLDSQVEMIATLGKAGPMPWSSRIDLKPLLVSFKDIYQRRQEEAKLKPERELPARFQNAGTWTYRTAKQEHPCFATTNNIYGSKVPSQAQMTNLYHGANGRFTKSFPNNFKNDSLKCSKTRSRVHSQLDEF